MIPRTAGRATIKSIATALGVSPAGLRGHFVKAGLVLSKEAAPAVAAEDDALPLRLDDLVDTVAMVAKGILGDFAKRLRGKPGASCATPCRAP